MRRVSLFLQLVILLIGVSFATTLNGQSLMRGWEIGPWGGVSYYFGDLNTNYRLNKPNVAGAILARYNFNDQLSFTLSGTYGKIEPYDSDARNPFASNRNPSFATEIRHVPALTEFNFLP